LLFGVFSYNSVSYFKFEEIGGLRYEYTSGFREKFSEKSKIIFSRGFVAIDYSNGLI
jgi:hypothetical protein